MVKYVYLYNRRMCPSLRSTRLWNCHESQHLGLKYTLCGIQHTNYVRCLQFCPQRSYSSNASTNVHRYKGLKGCIILTRKTKMCISTVLLWFYGEHNARGDMYSLDNLLKSTVKLGIAVLIFSPMGHHSVSVLIWRKYQ